MSILDISILVVFVFAVVYGLIKGVITQMGSLIGILVGVLGCRLFGDDLAEFFGSVLPALSENVATAAYINKVIANVVIFILLYIIVALFSRMIKNIMHALCLGIIDRVVGVLFSLFKYFLIFSLLLNIWLLVSPGTNYRAQSKLGDGVVIDAVVGMAPAVFGLANEMIIEKEK